MPLHELYRMAKGKLDSREMINTSCAPDQSTVPENDFLELVWENGQISVQGQSSRGRKSPTTCKSLPSHCLPSHCTNNYNSNNNDMMMRMGKFGDLDSGFNELRMPVPSGEDVGLTQDEDVMMPWLNYAMDEPLQHEYSSGFLHELSGVTMNDLPASNNFSLLDKRSNCNQVFRDSHRNYALSKGPSAAAREVENPAPKAGTSQFYHPSSHQYQASFASVRSRVSDVTENNASNATHHAPNCGDITQIFPSASSGFSSLKVMDKQDPIMSSSSSMTTIMNFSHFARPAAIVKANLQNIGLSSSRSENIGNKNKAAAAATASNPPESTKVCLSGDCPKESPTLQKKQAVEASKADLKQLETKSLEGIAALSKQSDPARNEDVSKTDQNSNLLHCESSNKGQEPVEKNVEPAVASSSVCSGNGAERGSGDLNQNLRRKRRDHEDSECHSEDVEEVSAGVKRAAPARGGTGFKRSRSAEVHNLSERRRRDRINEKMRALQELIPNCNKVDKASMLDEAIEYLKTLQLQVQIMSMGAGYYMPPMMLPAGMQHMHPPHMASFTPMGVGMQMGLGMGYGMGMHDINGGSSRFPMMPVPHMQGPHLPVTSMSGPSAFNGMGRSNPQVFGVPGQRLTTPMQRAPIFSLPGEPVLNSPAVGLNASGTAGVMENAISASASGLKDQTLNTNSQAMQKTNGCNSTNQMTTQCEVTAGGFEHSAAPEANDGDTVNAVKEDNK